MSGITGDRAKELAQKVKDAKVALNKAIQEATFAGLRVEVDTLVVSSLGHDGLATVRANVLIPTELLSLRAED